MRESFFQNLVAVNRLPHPLVVQLQRFTASLIEQSYADETVRLKVKLVTDLGQWLKRHGVAVADLDEPLVVLLGGCDRRPDQDPLQGRVHTGPAR